MPHLTGLRCRACVVHGGCEVASAEEAAEVNAIPRVEMAIRTGQRAPVAVGEVVELPVCVEAGELQTYRERGRDCPFVALEPENGEALVLLAMSIGEDPLTLAYYDAVVAGWPAEERLRVLRRVRYARGHREVSEALEARTKPKD